MRHGRGVGGLESWPLSSLSESVVRVDMSELAGENQVHTAAEVGPLGKLEEGTVNIAVCRSTAKCFVVAWAAVISRAKGGEYKLDQGNKVGASVSIRDCVCP